MGLNFKKPAGGEAVITKSIEENKQVLAQEELHEQVKVPEQVVDPSPSSDPFCEVGFNAGYTHPLAPYKSCKFGVSLRIPCKHSEIDGVFEFAKDWVDQRMQVTIAELES